MSESRRRHHVSDTSRLSDFLYLGPETFEHKVYSGNRRRSNRHTSTSKKKRENTKRNRNAKVPQHASSDEDSSYSYSSSESYNEYSQGSDTGSVSSTSNEASDGYSYSGSSYNSDEVDEQVKVIYSNDRRGTSGRREITHGTMDKLIEQLTHAHEYSSEFRDIFFLTFTSFTNSSEFVDLLISRYNNALSIANPGSLILCNEEEGDGDFNGDLNSVDSAQKVIVRLVNVLKYWIKDNGYIHSDLCEDQDAKDKLIDFLAEINHTCEVQSLRQITKSMREIVKSISTNRSRKLRKSGSRSNRRQHYSASSRSRSSRRQDRHTRSKSRHRNRSSRHRDSKTEPKRHSSKKTSRHREERINKKGVDPESRRCNDRKPSTRSLSSASERRKQHASGRVNNHNLPPPPPMTRGVTTGSVDLAPSSRLRSASGDESCSRKARSYDGRSKSRPLNVLVPLIKYSPQEIAEQLTLTEAEDYLNRINLREFTNRAWTRENKYTMAPHVMAMIELFDSRAQWVSSEILLPKMQTVERAKMIGFFIDVADYCRRLHNFNTMFEIMTGISAPCIKKLSTTWTLVDTAHLEKYVCLEQLCNVEENHKNYRQAIALCEGQARIPYIVVLVKDLHNLEESNPTVEHGLINFQKFRKVYERLIEVRECKNTSYTISSNSSQRSRKLFLKHDFTLQKDLRDRLETIRKNSNELNKLAYEANTNESVQFVNSLSEAGFL